MSKKKIPRRSRRKKNPDPKAVRIEDRDRRFFRYLNEHKVMRTPHFRALESEPSKNRTVGRRLNRLWDANYVEKIDQREEFGGSWNDPDIWVLDEKGAAALPGEDAKWRRNVENPGRSDLTHELLVTDFLVMVRVACKASHGKVRYIPHTEVLATSKSERLSDPRPLLLRAKVPTGRGGWKFDTTNPDGFFGLEFPEVRKRKYFFFEADRGKMPQKRGEKSATPDASAIVKKYKVYHYFRKHAECEFGITSYNVLFLTDKGDERVRSARNKLQKVAPNRYSWLFSHKNEIMPDPKERELLNLPPLPPHYILDVPWLGGDDNEYSLTYLPKPNTTRTPQPVN